MKKTPLFLLLLVTIVARAAADDSSNVYGRCRDNDVFSIANRAMADNKQALKLALRVSGCNVSILQQYTLAHPLQFSDAQLQQMFSGAQLDQIAQNLFTYVQQTRQDKQVGTSANSVGTTSLVSKGVGAIVGIALESGSIERTTSGNVATVTLNSAQAADFLSAGATKPCPVIESKCSLGRKLLTGLTIVTTYDVTQANTSTNSTAAQTALASLVGGNSPAFTGVSARIDFHARKKGVNQLDLIKAYQSSDYLSATATYASAFQDFITSLDSNSEYQKAIADAIDALTNTTTNDTDAKVDQILLNLQIAIANIINNSPLTTTAFKTYVSAENAYHGKRDIALQAVLNKWTASFQYDYNRLPNQPDQSDFRAIYSYRRDTPDNQKVLQVTANAGATIYDSLLGSTTSRFRSAQAAFQLDYTATSTASTVQAAVSGGYYFQYMIAKGLLTLPSTNLAPGTSIPLPGNASELLNTTGPIHIGQGKITLSMKNSNISIPLALTFSNRTDLIKASKVGGNFGITYDFSSLFAALKN
jgi:hypothetical protein